MQPFTQKLIPFSNTNCFDKLIIDYLNDDDFLRNFYVFDDTPLGVKERIDTYINPRLNRPILKEIIQKQYSIEGINQLPELVQLNINSLSDSNTFTITTGHQLNIFSGPLYVFYKLISAINLAEKLKLMYPSFHFVPVYWMATEDHDIKEISSFNLFGKKYDWNNSWKGPSGKMPLDGISDVIGEMKATFGNSPYAEELTSIMEQSYLGSNSLSEATRKWVNALFGKYGLVIVDGNDVRFKKLITDIFSDEILNQSSSSLINKTSALLEQKYHSQAKPREINLFYIGDDFRNRITRENENIKVLNSDLVLSVNDTVSEINLHPEKFSPNVVLRPLYQESILPNVAFIGGPAEIAYWLELKELFQFHHVPMPVLFHRSSAMIFENTTINKLDKLSIKKTDVFLSSDELIKNFIQNRDSLSFQKIYKTVATEFENLAVTVSKMDTSLRVLIDAENQKIATTLHALEDKIIRALKKKNETEVNQIRKLKEKLFPAGVLQERDETMIPYYLKWGSGFIDMLKENLNPLQKQFVMLEEQKES